MRIIRLVVANAQRRAEFDVAINDAGRQLLAGEAVIVPDRVGIDNRVGYLRYDAKDVMADKEIRGGVYCRATVRETLR